MKYSVILLFSAVLVVTACAKRPDEIAAVPMDTDLYASLSCRNLAAKETGIRNELDSLSAAQNSAIKRLSLLLQKGAWMRLTLFKHKRIVSRHFALEN